MVMLAVGGGSDKCRRRAWEIQALAVACKRELGPEQRRHREEGGALEPVPMADADHGVSLPLTGTDATDPSQSLARPRAGAAQMWSARTVRRSTWQGEVHWPPPIPSSGSWPAPRSSGSADRKSDVEGKRGSVRGDLGGYRIIKKNKETTKHADD